MSLSKEYKQSLEQRQKTSKALSLVKPGDKRRAPRSEEVKQRLREFNIGRKASEEAKANMRLGSARKWSETQWKNFFKKNNLEWTGDTQVGLIVRARELGIDVVDYDKTRIRRKLREKDPNYFKEKAIRLRNRRDKNREAVAGRPKPEICEICSTNDFKIVFDHCHNEGHFRGWICDRCNRVLGLMKDNLEWFKAITVYLEKDHGLTNDEKAQRTPDKGLCVLS